MRRPILAKVQVQHQIGLVLQKLQLLKRTALLLALALLLVFLSENNEANAQMIVAHRGASADAPENTLAAFKEAWRQGADGIEGDFYVTQDGHVVCIHDKDTLRTAGKKLQVAATTLPKLRELEFGSWKSPEFHGEKIPTLTDVLATVPEGKHFVIELKTGPSIVPLVKAALLEQQADLSKILIISFHEDTIAKSKELLPDVRAHWLTGYKKNTLTGTYRPSAKSICATLKNCRADGLGMQGNREVVTEDFVDNLREGGMKEFHVWTIDDPQDAKYFQALGAIGITTNRPLAIRNSLEAAQ